MAGDPGAGRLGVLLFFFFASAPATVRVFVQESNSVAWVNYECTAGEVIRAFAVDVTVDKGRIISISDFLRGPSTAAKPGYGVFPAERRGKNTITRFRCRAGASKEIRYADNAPFIHGHVHSKSPDHPPAVHSYFTQATELLSCTNTRTDAGAEMTKRKQSKTPTGQVQNLPPAAPKGLSRHNPRCSARPLSRSVAGIVRQPSTFCSVIIGDLSIAQSCLFIAFYRRQLNEFLVF